MQAEFEHHGGYTYMTRIQQVLSGLGFRARMNSTTRCRTSPAGSAHGHCWHACF